MRIGNFFRKQTLTKRQAVRLLMEIAPISCSLQLHNVLRFSEKFLKQEPQHFPREFSSVEKNGTSKLDELKLVGDVGRGNQSRNCTAEIIWKLQNFGKISQKRLSEFRYDASYIRSADCSTGKGVALLQVRNAVVRYHERFSRKLIKKDRKTIVMTRTMHGLLSCSIENGSGLTANENCFR